MLIASFTGIDETVGEPTHTRRFYNPHEILWNRRFVDIVRETSQGYQLNQNNWTICNIVRHLIKNQALMSKLITVKEIAFKIKSLQKNHYYAQKSSRYSHKADRICTKRKV